MYCKDICILLCVCVVLYLLKKGGEILNRIKELRDKKGLTLKELSKQLAEKQHVKISPDSLAKYERGERNPKIDKATALAEFFNVSVSYLQGETFSQKDIIRILSYEYTSYVLNEYDWIKKETAVGVILKSYNLMDSLTDTVNNYLIYHNAKLPLQCFTSDELKKCTYDVETFWMQNFSFIFNDSTVKAIMKYGYTSVFEMLKTLTKVICSKYLKDTATAVSKKFDKVVENDLKEFISNKDELLRFATKEKIKNEVGSLISQLENFESSVDGLPANKPKPVRIDTTINYNSKNN